MAMILFRGTSDKWRVVAKPLILQLTNNSSLSPVWVMNCGRQYVNLPLRASSGAPRAAVSLARSRHWLRTFRLLSSSAILDLSSLRAWTLQSVGAVDRRTATMRIPAKFHGAKANSSRRLICTRGPGLSLLYVFGASQVCILDLEPRAFLGEGPGTVPGCLPQLAKHQMCSAQKVRCP